MAENYGRVQPPPPPRIIIGLSIPLLCIRPLLYVGESQAYQGTFCVLARQAEYII